jgi:hypothetical protein
MNTSRLRAVVLFGLVASGAAAIAQSSRGIDNGLLNVKKTLSERESTALQEPFLGVHSGNRAAPGLFPVRATGVSTEPIRKAGVDFLNSLTPAQLIRTVYAVDDPEWRRWSNVDNGLYVRQGVSSKELSPTQRTAATALMRASLSAKGMELAQSIMKTDQTLAEINKDIVRYDSQLYFFTIMGNPSPTEPWGWQLEGHHLVINYFVLGDQVVMTPMFLGAEPAVTTTGRYAGNTVLQAEQDKGLAFMQSLTASQRESATIKPVKVADELQSGAGQDNLVLDYRGIKASAMTDAQKAQLVELIGLYVDNMREAHARVRMTEVAAHLGDTYFAWSGGTADDDVFYYRIHSPVVLIEFDHQRPVGTRGLNPPDRPTRMHIHVMVRTPNGNDYGKDLLRQHLTTHPHEVTVPGGSPRPASTPR